MDKRTLQRVVKVGLALLVVALAGLVLLDSRAPAQGPTSGLELIASDNLASPGLDGQTKPRGQNGEVSVLGNTAFVAGGSLYHGARATAGRICTDYGGVKNVDLSDPANPVRREPIDVNDTLGVGAPWPAANPRRAEAAAPTPTGVGVNRRFPNVAVTAIAVDTLSSTNFTSNNATNPVRNVLAVGVARCEPTFFAGGRIDLFDVDNPANPVLLTSYELPRGLGTLEDVQLFTRGSKVFALATIPFNKAQGPGPPPLRGDMRLVDITTPQAPVDLPAGDFPPSPPLGPDPASNFSGRNGCQTFFGGRAVTPTPDGSGAFLSFYDGTANFDPLNLHTEAVFKLGLTGPTTGTGSTSLLGTWGYVPAKAAEGSAGDNDVEGNAAEVEAFPGAEGNNRVMVSEDDLDPAFTLLQIQNPASAASAWRACESIVTTKLYQLPNQELIDDVAYLGRGCPGSKLTGSTNVGDETYTDDPNGKIALLDGGPSPFDGCSPYERFKRAIDAGAVAVMSTTGENLLNSTSNGPPGGIPQRPTMTITLDAYRKMQLIPNPVPSNTFAFDNPPAWKRTSTNVTAVSGSYPGRPERARFRSVADASDPVARGETNDQNPSGVCGTGSTCRAPVTAGQQYRAGAFMQLESWTAGTFRTAVVWFNNSGAPIGESVIGSRTGAPSARSLETQIVTAPTGAAAATTAVAAAVKFEWTGAGAAGVGFADNFFMVPVGLTARLKDLKGQWGGQRILDFSKSNPAANIATYRSPRSLVWPPPGNGIYAPRGAKIVGDRAFTAWLSDGVRVLDVSNPAAPNEIASFVPPATPDPSPQAGAGSTNTPPRTDSASLELRRGASWPTVPLVTGVDVLRRDGQPTHLVVSDINGGLYVLRCTGQACVSSPGAGPTPTPPASAAFPDCPALTANVIRGTAASNSIVGTPRSDRIFAGTGDDVVDGQAGNDCIDLGPGTDRGQGGSGRDLMAGGLGRDRMAGGTGIDRMRGGGAADRLLGGFGNDRLHGQSGTDRILGERGRDRINGGSSNDRISGGSWSDRIAGDQGNDRITGNSGNDSIRGNSGRDRLTGSSGRDRLAGGSGRDRIDARDGQRDRVNCGSGNDTVIADAIDRVAGNCERVVRRRSRAARRSGRS